MKECKLSIIVPAYNADQYLKKCLDSIMKQNDPSVEILLINDGSTDQTASIFDAYGKKYDNVKVFHKDNSGIADTRNFAIERVSGTYFMFVDSDDYIQDRAIERILERIKRGNGFDVMIGRHTNYDMKNGRYEENPQIFSEKIVESLQGEKLLQYLLTKGTYDWFPWLNIVRTDYLRKEKLFFQSGVYFEDAMWVPELLMKAEKVTYMESPFYVYIRNRDGAITSLITEKAYQDKMKVCDYTRNFIAKFHISDEVARDLLGNTNRIYASLLADAWTFDKKKRKVYLKEVGKDKKILLFSKRHYMVFLYYMQKVVGLNLVSYLLFKRAESVRQKRREY